MKWHLTAWLAAANFIVANAFGEPQSVTLSPANMLAQTHSHAIVLALTSTYRQLSGTLRFDPVARTCSIDATFVVDSLTAPSAMLRAQIMARSFLDPQDYPVARYQGTCAGNQLIGTLTLRGQTHPFDMQFAYLGDPAHPAAIHAEGVLDRHQWGINGLRMTVSSKIRVTNDISLNGQPPAELTSPR